MNVCSVLSMAVLLGNFVIIDAYPLMYQQPMYNQPVYYGPPPQSQPDVLSLFLPESQRTEPSALRRLLLQIDDITAAGSFVSSNPVQSLSAVSELYSSYSGEREPIAFRALAAAFDVFDLFSPDPFANLFAITSLYLAFTGS